MSPLLDRLYRSALRLYPEPFREEFGEEMTRDFSLLLAERRRLGAASTLGLAGRALIDAFWTAVRLHGDRPRFRPARRRKPFPVMIRQNLRNAWRQLAARPAFTLVVVLTIALGIGANSALFDLVYRVLLQPLPFEAPEKLVMVRETDLARGTDRNSVTPANYEDWRAASRSFSSLAALVQTSMNLSGEGEPERITTHRVSAELFPLLRVTASAGRVFAPDEDREEGPKVALLSHGFWERRFGADRNVLERTIRLDDVPYRVVGVLPPWFRFPSRDTELYVPLAMNAQERTSRMAHYLEVIGRLGADATLPSAQVEMDGVAARLAEAYPDTNAGNGVALFPLQDELVGESATPILVLFAAVGFVLLLASVNVANLLVARSASRRREVAVRSALGATRVQLAQQFLVEALSIALAGAALGAALCLATRRALAILTPRHVSPDSTFFDPAVMLFTLVLTLVVGLGIGALPAIELSRSGARLDTGMRGSASSRIRAGVRRGLVVFEVALAVVLLAGAGLTLRSFSRLATIDPGFRTDDVVTMRMELSRTKYPDLASKNLFYGAVLERVERFPDVVSAGFVSMLPLTFQGGSVLIGIEGVPVEPGREPVVVFRSVTPDYFRTMGIRLRKGRGFERTDAPETTKVAVVNERFVRAHLGGGDALGRRIDIWGGPTEIVGVVDDVHETELGSEARPALYVSAAQRSFGFFDPRDLAVRTRSNPENVVASIRAEVRAIDPDQPIANVRTMEEIASESVGRERTQTWMLLSFGALALALASLGLYGVLSYIVSERTGEIGLRMALGASRRDVVQMVLGQGMRWVVVGLIFGLGSAVALGRYLEGWLYGVEPGDPMTLASISFVLLVVALAACLAPTYRATRVDAVVALREET